MLELLLNLAAVGLTVGSLYALIAVSFALIFNVTHVFHLAHGATFAVGAYLIYLFATMMGLPFLVAVGASLLCTAAFGVAIEVGLYRPLRRAAAPPTILFLASVGVLIVVEGLLGLVFGTTALSFETLPFQPVALGPVTLTTANVGMLASWPLIAAVLVYLGRSHHGRFLRAVGDSEPVARSLGIPLDRVFVLSFALGSALAVPAALLYGWSQGLVPVMGLNGILIGSAAVIIGGRHGLLPGALVALVIGTVQAVLVAFIPTGWQDGIIFSLLLAALLVRAGGHLRVCPPMVNYVAQILIAVAIAAVLAGSLNLILGYTGLFSVVHAAFFGIGAYAAAQVVLLLKVPFPLDLLAAFLAAAAIAALIGPPIARLNEEYIIVGTLALQLVLSNVFLNWQPVTGGSYGIFGIPRPALFGYPLTGLVDYAIFVVAIAALCFLGLWWLVRSPYGLALKALREDPLLAQSLGKNVNRQRVIAFALGSGVAGIAGMLYARYVGYIDPSTFGIGQSLSIITILVVGGLGNLWGTLLAAAILETVPQVLRFIPAFSQAVAHLQLVFFGLLLVGLVRLRPQGLISERPLVRARAVRRAADAPPAGPAAPSQAPALSASLAARPPAGQAAPLAVQHVSKSFGGLRAVVDLSLSIEPGRVTAIIGPNGAGKTTLFNILSGYLHPDQGEIRYGDHDLTRLRPFEIARLGIARSFQDVRVFSRMTVLENVVLTIQGHAVERLSSVFSPSGWALREQERARQRALELLGSFGLLPFADERVANLSYAQQKLLVVVTLVARDDPLILLDELAAGLDHDSVAAFSRLVREMAAGGRTVCLIEHNLDFVWQTADTVLVLDQGQLIAEGSPEQIQRDQHVAEIYFGSARAVDA